MAALSRLLTPGRVDQIVERRSLMSSEVRYWDGKEISWSTATVPSGWAVPHHVVCGSDRVPRVITPPIIASTRPCDCPHASASDHWIWTSATCDICCLSTALRAPSSRSWLLTYLLKQAADCYLYYVASALPVYAPWRSLLLTMNTDTTVSLLLTNSKYAAKL